MTLTITSEAPPLRVDPSGALRVGESRVLMELVIQAFQEGATPETIVQSYPTTTLADVYSVIGYYLHHQAEIAAYLEERERTAAAVRQRIEAKQGDLRELKERICASAGRCYSNENFVRH
jgi:uncharacterized protein (DUF433 family)